MTASVVAVVAHPDDESLIAGGTLALAADAGLATGAVSLTRGEWGPISDPALATQETLGDVRESELAAAAAALGAGFSACLHAPDGELPWADHDALAGELAGLLGGDGPVAILTFGDDGLYGHHDHAAAKDVALLALDRREAAGAPAGELWEAAWAPGGVAALVAAARERGLPADLWGLEPEAFGAEAGEPTVRIDVGSVLSRKLAALRAHRTQLGEEHLLAALPEDLAARFLHEEPWRLARGDGAVLRTLVGTGAAHG